jgi:retron-type reverse transcriptase
MMNGTGKSDSPILPAKPANKAGRSAAEPVEGSGGTKRNAELQSTVRTQSRDAVSQAQDRIREAVNRNKKAKITALLHHVDIDVLRWAFFSLKKRAAPGVDGVTWDQYEENLETRLINLHERVHTGTYRALPSRRRLIPKTDGRYRTLGIAAIEDKILQAAVVALLTPIYEAEFLGFSYGFRPGRSQHDALDALAYGIKARKICWILDSDIQSFFDQLSREWLVRFVEYRIGDRRIIRLIQKWLTAGVLEEGRRIETTSGTPQGSVASPLLANAYLHYGAPGQTWCFQRVKFPPRQEVEPPHRESSLGSEEVTNRTKRRQSDARAVTKVKQISLVKYLSAGRQHRSGWQAPVGAPQMARWPETAAGSECTARSETEASRDLGDPLRSRSALGADRVCRTIWLTPEKGRRCSAKSDSLVVLRARESRVHGEAAKQMKTGFRENGTELSPRGI